MTRVAMLSGPRNISTTMMRAFENRADTVVFDEPYYACYLKETGADHPLRDAVFASQSADWAEVSDGLSCPLPDGIAYGFEKHIAYHFPSDADLGWLRDRRAFLLIRNPREMVASFQNKYHDVAPIVESLRLQRRVFDQHDGLPVIDAADVLRDPEAMLNALCRRLQMPFTDQMLTWPAGRRPSDGVWGAHWYDAVESSTGFRPYVPKDLSLSLELEALVEGSWGDYAFLHARRLDPI